MSFSSCSFEILSCHSGAASSFRERATPTCWRRPATTSCGPRSRGRKGAEKQGGSIKGIQCEAGCRDTSAHTARLLRMVRRVPTDTRPRKPAD